jgi:cell division protease FtsH
MSDKLGPLTFGATATARMPGWAAEVGTPRSYSDETLRIIDAEVKAIMAAEYTRAHQQLTRQRPVLDAIAQELLVHETLQRADMESIAQEASRPQVRTAPNGAIAA